MTLESSRVTFTKTPPPPVPEPEPAIANEETPSLASAFALTSPELDVSVPPSIDVAVS